eukprot:scaffold11278_cov145-Isochrysis_galbana.AAC.4
MEKTADATAARYAIRSNARYLALASGLHCFIRNRATLSVRDSHSALSTLNSIPRCYRLSLSSAHLHLRSTRVHDRDYVRHVCTNVYNIPSARKCGGGAGKPQPILNPEPATTLNACCPAGAAPATLNCVAKPITSACCNSTGSRSISASARASAASSAFSASQSAVVQASAARLAARGPAVGSALSSIAICSRVSASSSARTSADTSPPPLSTRKAERQAAWPASSAAMADMPASPWRSRRQRATAGQTSREEVGGCT